MEQVRLSDHVMGALDIALDQKDILVAEKLFSVLEVVMTRNAGGQDFVERREFPEKVNESLNRLMALKESETV